MRLIEARLSLETWNHQRLGDLKREGYASWLEVARQRVGSWEATPSLLATKPLMCVIVPAIRPATSFFSTKPHASQWWATFFSLAPSAVRTSRVVTTIPLSPLSASSFGPLEMTWHSSPGMDPCRLSVTSGEPTRSFVAKALLVWLYISMT